MGEVKLAEDLLSLGVLDEKTVKALRKLMAASSNPEIAALASAAIQTTAPAPEKKAVNAPASPLQAEYAEKLRDKRSANKRRKNAANARIIIVAVIVLALFSVMTYGRVELSKLYSEKAEMEDQLMLLHNENVSLESELAQQTGLTKVEEYAENKLGLQKLDKSQIEYVEVEEKTSATVVEDPDSNIFVDIQEWFNGVLEYLGV
jgi:hypothetical protein